ncbi:TIGR02206 family membrane protein [Cohnella candidum]|nr:TIGR02206 family membrane protein [Cohnella candidum]
MTFEPFSPAHWAAIAFTAAFAAAILGFRRRLAGKSADRAVRWGLAGVLAASEVSLYAWYTVTDNWGLYALPFQLCTMTLWLSVAALLTRNARLSEVSFFLGILGALQAVLTPNLDETFPNFRYFHFFVAHAAIIGSGVYLAAVQGYRPTWRSALRAWGWLNVLAVPAAVANAAAGENFMFLARKPDTASMLDLLAPWPWYILQLEIIAAGLCLLLAGIVKLTVNRFTIRKETTGYER